MATNSSIYPAKIMNELFLLIPEHFPKEYKKETPLALWHNVTCHHPCWIQVKTNQVSLWFAHSNACTITECPGYSICKWEKGIIFNILY